MLAELRPWSLVWLTMLLSLPLAALIVAWLAATRSRPGVPRRQVGLTSAIEVGMVVGTVPWIWMILTPGAGEGGVELVPGRGLWQILTGDPGFALIQVVGNLLVFAAFGFLAPIRWRLGPAVLAAVVAAASATLEFVQYAAQLGRVASVDDVLLNTCGAVCAAYLARPWWRAVG